MTDEIKTTLASTKTKKAKTKAELPWPNTLWRLAPGQRLVMKGTTAVVSTTDRQGRPLTVCVRNAENKVVSVPFELEDFIRLK